MRKRKPKQIPPDPRSPLSVRRAVLPWRRRIRNISDYDFLPGGVMNAGGDPVNSFLVMLLFPLWLPAFVVFLVATVEFALTLPFLPFALLRPDARAVAGGGARPARPGPGTHGAPNVEGGRNARRRTVQGTGSAAMAVNAERVAVGFQRSRKGRPLAMALLLGILGMSGYYALTDPSTRPFVAPTLVLVALAVGYGVTTRQWFEPSRGTFVETHWWGMRRETSPLAKLVTYTVVNAAKAGGAAGSTGLFR